MAKRWFPLLFTVLVVLVPAWPAHAATVPAGDFVTGGGVTVGFPECCGPEFPFRYQNIVLNAHSDSSGGNVSGTVSFDFAVSTASDPNNPPSVVFSLAGPVTCLAVHGNDAIIGFTDTKAGFGPSVVHVIDNGSSGSPPDEFFSDPIATNCASLPPGLHGGNLVSGDMVIHDVDVPTSKQQCYGGGWRHLVDDAGMAFRNQGLCVAFVATHTSR